MNSGIAISTISSYLIRKESVIWEDGRRGFEDTLMDEIESERERKLG